METMQEVHSDLFSDLDLGDQRRTNRLQELVGCMCRHPGGTLPNKLHRPADLRAFYRLMDCERVTHQVLVRSHAQRTRERIADVGATTRVLVLHDATELDYSTRKLLSSRMGQVGAGQQRGYICHNSLAVRADTREVLGLTAQILHHRADVPKQETGKQRRERESRESRLWVQGVAATGPAPAGVRCVDVSDTLSDTFEYIFYEMTHQRSFVLRARENRRLALPLHDANYLFEAVRRLPAVGTYSIWVSAQAGGRALDRLKKKSPRHARLRVAFAPVTLAPPGKRSGEYLEEPLRLWVVRAWEIDPPPDEDPLEWILLSNEPVDTFDDARERIGWYEQRPIIEEFHKAMKTGCSTEAMQFDTIDRLEPAIAVLSAVATTLLRLRDAARAPDAETRPATEVVDRVYVEVLTTYYRGRLSTRPSVKAFYLHVARLGGHQNRKCDGLPGWITLWRGWMRLQSMVDYHITSATRRKRCGKT